MGILEAFEQITTYSKKAAKSSPTLNASNSLWEFNKLLCSFPDLFNHGRSFTPLTESFIQSSQFTLFLPFSTFTVSPAPPPSFYAPLSFLISDSFSSPLLSHSYTSVRPSICLPLLPPSYLSLFSQSVSRSISRPQEIVSFAIQRVGGVYSLSQTKRSLCESSKNTKKKRKADKIRNLLSSASRIQTHMHTLYLRCTRAKHFPNIQQRHKILFSF